MPPRLGLNIDHVATLREARKVGYPCPIAAALLGELAGAAQITCHIRGDRRHIQDRDLTRLRASVQTLLNVELAVTDEMRAIALEVMPHRVTLVPERPGEVSTEGGLDVVRHRDAIAAFTADMQAAGVRVALFIDPVSEQVHASAMPGVDMVELNTAAYAEGGGAAELERLHAAAVLCQDLGVEVAAGHGLTHHNLPDLVAAVPEITEYNIGHAIIGRAVFVGLEQAVRDICRILAGQAP
jgi:pyridoxine 5-phosphate synthase